MQEEVKKIIQELGEDPEREGLLKTPERVEKSLHYLTADISRIWRMSFTVRYLPRNRMT